MTKPIVHPDQIPQKSLAHFWAKVDKRGPDDCWLWFAGCFNSGYGAITIQGDTYRAHVISYLIHKGPLPPDKPLVCHTCNIRQCVNPNHLYADDSAGNLRYMVECGRSMKGDRNGSRLHPERLKRGAESPATLHPERMARGSRNGHNTHPERTPRGETSGQAKLTEDQVREIRKLYATGKYFYAALGKQFAVTKQNIRYIVKRMAWKHVV